MWSQPAASGPGQQLGQQPLAARQQQQRSSPTAGPSQAPPQPTGLSLERAAFMTPGGAPRPAAAGEMRPTSSIAAKSGMPLSGFDGPPAKAGAQEAWRAAGGQPPAAASKPPPASKPRAPAGSTNQPASEGRPGARWRALRSEKFNDIIVRETMEVASKTLRRIQPGEVCIQRGATVMIETGLVRMQIEPDGGWVTVHARNIQGPTFLEEADAPSDRPASFDIRLQQQAGPPSATDARAPAGVPPPPRPATKAAGAAPRAEHVPMPPSRAGAEATRGGAPGPSKASPARDRPTPSKASSRGEERKAQAKAVVPIGAAPWQDGEDPWSKNTDPWAKAGGADPWASAAPKRPPAQAARGPPSKGQPTSSGQGPSWGKDYAASSATTPGVRYDRMEMLRVRERLVTSSSIGPAPPQVAQIRTLRIPNMEAAVERRSKRSERDRADRERRDQQRAGAPAAGDDHSRDGGGTGTALLRERGNAAARDSPLRGEAGLEPNADRQQRPGPPVGAASANRGASPSAAASAGSPTGDKREEKKAKEDAKANCPTQ